MKSTFILALQVLLYGSVLLFSIVHAQVADPVPKLDIVDEYRLHNHFQCERLCSYFKVCSHYSFHSRNDNSKGICTLHWKKIGGNSEPGIDGEATMGQKSSPGCSGRPCGEEEMCITVHASARFICVGMRVDWLDRRCRTGHTCNTPPSAGSTACFNGWCLCSDRHFYSVSQRACVSKCPVLGGSYLQYYGFDLRGHNVEYKFNVTDIYVCMAHCSATRWCIAVVYFRKWEKCHFKSIFVLDDPSARRLYHAKADTLWRTCL
ncbi:hypothetical protein ACOMHN_064068 [Nucella lapillus]